MGTSRLNNFLKAVATFLIIGVVSFYAASIMVMHHDSGMPVNCPVITAGTGDCTQSQSADLCISYHLGLLHNLSEAVFGHGGLLFFIFLFGMLFVLAVFGFLNVAIRWFDKRSRIRLRQLYEEIADAFLLQLGYWLVLFEKRDPALAFTLA